MTLYEINADIDALIDKETGEILDMDAFDALKLDRREKLENIALLAKNKAADVKALKEEEASLKRKRRGAEHTLTWCKATLERELAGKGMEDERKRFKIYYQPSESVRIHDFDLIPHEFVKDLKDLPESVRDSLVSKSAIMDAIKSGKTIPGASLEEKKSIVIR